MSAVDSNADITPFSHNKVPQLDSSNWGNVSVSELWDQMGILNARYLVVAEMGKAEYMLPLQRAIAELSAVIQSRNSETETNITNW